MIYLTFFRMKILPLLFFMCCLFPALKAQLPEQECSGAILVCQDTTVFQSYADTGLVQEIFYGTNTSCLLGGEEYSVWIKFVTSDTGKLEFEIKPLTPGDDYDWALYHYALDSCEDVISDVTYELRCNYSAIPGATGCDSPYTTISVNAAGPNQCAPVVVSTGEKFLLLVNNHAATSDGFELIFDSITPLAPCDWTTNFSPQQSEMDLYPNPSDGNFMIAIPVSVGMAHLEMFNCMGQMVYETDLVIHSNQNSFPVHISKPGGLYFLKLVTADQKSYTSRVLLEHSSNFVSKN